MPGMTNVVTEPVDDCTDIEPTLYRRITRRIAADHDMDIAEAERIMVGTVAFPRVCARYPHQGLAPSKKIDIGWHAFLLYTREYAVFCESLGGFVHHGPNDDGLAEPVASAQATVGFIRSLGIAFDADLAERRVPAGRVVRDARRAVRRRHVVGAGPLRRAAPDMNTRPPDMNTRLADLTEVSLGQLRGARRDSLEGTTPVQPGQRAAGSGGLAVLGPSGSRMTDQRASVVAGLAVRDIRADHNGALTTVQALAEADDLEPNGHGGPRVFRPY